MKRAASARSPAVRGRAGRGRESLASLVGAIVLVGVAGVLAAAIMRYLDLHGPSGNSPNAWSYTGNGALAVLAYCPLILLAGWTFLAVTERGYRPRIACVVCLIALTGGVVAGLVNEIGVVGQLPDPGRTRPVYQVAVNGVVAALALIAGLAVLARIAARRRRAIIGTSALALATTLVGGWLALGDAWYSLSLTQGILVFLTIAAGPLLGAPPATASQRPRRLLTVLGVLLVPLAMTGGFVLGNLAAPLFTGS